MEIDIDRAKVEMATEHLNAALVLIRSAIQELEASTAIYPAFRGKVQVISKNIEHGKGVAGIFELFELLKNFDQESAGSDGITRAI